ncbi:MAG: hypothetical protein KAV87_49515 [Desulfobacteraceae bacterium]|nr:hypothetical protein [Desulfobacteraceae bacterium]
MDLDREYEQKNIMININTFDRKPSRRLGEIIDEKSSKGERTDLKDASQGSFPKGDFPKEQ